MPSNASRNAPADAPALAWGASHGCSEFKAYADVKMAMRESHFSVHTPFNDSYTRAHRRDYFAAASFIDAQIGKVMAALEASGLGSTTVVTLMGDHGWVSGISSQRIYFYFFRSLSFVTHSYMI